MNGKLYIISAPSGAGKTSLVAQLVNSFNNLEVSISHTTRQPRVVEKNGVDYHFVSQEEFDNHLKNKEFLEHATVFGHSYGTSKKWVASRLDNGIDVILEIDWQGAQQVFKASKDIVSIFILPPSHEVLQARLQARAQDDEDVIAKRLAAAKSEIKHYKQYQYVVINDDFAQALLELQSIIRAERVKASLQSPRVSKILQELLD